MQGIGSDSRVTTKEFLFLEGTVQRDTMSTSRCSRLHFRLSSAPYGWKKRQGVPVTKPGVDQGMAAIEKNQRYLVAYTKVAENVADSHSGCNFALLFVEETPSQSGKKFYSDLHDIIPLRPP
jgi:hypothetical protein